MKETRKAATSCKRRSLRDVFDSDFMSKLETMTHDEKLASTLDHIQLILRKDEMYLMRDDGDWLVVLQCLQDNNLFKNDTRRMPLSAFVARLEALGVPQYGIRYDMRKMSRANTRIEGKRYPWEGCVMMPSGILRRWDELYRLTCWVLQKHDLLSAE